MCTDFNKAVPRIINGIIKLEVQKLYRWKGKGGEGILNFSQLKISKLLIGICLMLFNLIFSFLLNETWAD